jgi:hypothetical protein
MSSSVREFLKRGTSPRAPQASCRGSETGRGRAPPARAGTDSRSLSLSLSLSLSQSLCGCETGRGRAPPAHAGTDSRSLSSLSLCLSVCLSADVRQDGEERLPLVRELRETVQARPCLHSPPPAVRKTSMCLSTIPSPSRAWSAYSRAANIHARARTHTHTQTHTSTRKHTQHTQHTHTARTLVPPTHRWRRRAEH